MPQQCRGSRSAPGSILVRFAWAGPRGTPEPGPTHSRRRASWLKSDSDQAAFATGGDVQVDLPAPLEPGGAGALTARGVTHAMAVTVNQANPGTVLAVDAAQASQVVRLRGDESPLPAGKLFHDITPAVALPGVVLPAPQAGPRAGTVQLTATLGPAASTPRDRRPISP